MRIEPGIQTTFDWFEGQQELAPIEPEPAPALPADLDPVQAIRDLPCLVIL